MTDPMAQARTSAEREFACIASSGASDDFDALPGDYHITFDAIWNIACDASRRATLDEVRQKVEGMRSSCGSGGRGGELPCCVSTDDVLATLSGDGT